MFTEMIVYNFCSATIGQNEVLTYMQELIYDLKINNIDFSFLNFIDGNTTYPFHYKLIENIIGYIYKHKNILSLNDLYSAFVLFDKYYKTGTYPNVTCLSANDIDELKNIAVQYKIDSSHFFNSILLTGPSYKLDSPYGVAIYDIIDGGICINANLHKNSLIHETAHLLGIDDHYDIKTKVTFCCLPNTCLMQWDSIQGKAFCPICYNQAKILLTKVERHNTA